MMEEASWGVSPPFWLRAVSWWPAFRLGLVAGALILILSLAFALRLPQGCGCTWFGWCLRCLAWWHPLGTDL